MEINEKEIRIKLEKYPGSVICPSCLGHNHNDGLICAFCNNKGVVYPIIKIDGYKFVED